MRWIAELQQPGGSVTDWCDGDAPIGDIRNSIVSISFNGAGIDPWTRNRNGGRVDVVIAREALVGLEPSAGVDGRQLTLYLCPSSIAISTAYWLARYVLQVRGHFSNIDGSVTLQCVDALELLMQSRCLGAWLALHPLAIGAQIIAGDLLSGLPSWSIDAASFAASAVTGKEHWSTSRAEESPFSWNRAAVYEGTPNDTGAVSKVGQPVSSMLGDIITMMGGAITIGPGGRARFRTQQTASVRHFPVTEVRRSAPIDWSSSSVDTIRTEYLTRTSDAVFKPIPLEDVAAAGYTAANWNPYDPNAELTSQAYFAQESNAFNDQTGAPKVARQRELSATWANAVVNMPILFGTGTYADPSPPASTAIIQITSTQTELILMDPSRAGVCGMRWSNNFNYGSHTGVVVAAGVATISGVTYSSLIPLAHFAATDVISWWDNTNGLVRYGTITSVTGTGPWTITASTSAPNATSAAGVLWTAQATADRIDGSHPVYLRIDNEIFSVMQVRPSRATASNVDDASTDYDQRTGRWYPAALRATVVRAQLGTSSAVHSFGAPVFDLTIPVGMANDRQGRWSRGAATTEIEVPMHHADIEEGDLITFDDPRGLSRWHCPATGVDNTVLWEVLSFSADKSAGCCRLQLCWYGTQSIAVTRTYQGPVSTQPVWATVSPSGSTHWPSSTSRRYETSRIYDGSGRFSVSLWVRPEANDLTQTLIGRWQTGSRVWRLDLQTSGALRLYIASSTSDTGTNYVATPNVLTTLGRWYHIVAVYNGGQCFIVVDGVDQTLTTTGSINATTTGSTSVTQIGADGNGGQICHALYMCHVVMSTSVWNIFDLVRLAGPDGRPGIPLGTNGLTAWWPLTSGPPGAGYPLTETGTGNLLELSAEYPR